MTRCNQALHEHVAAIRAHDPNPQGRWYCTSCGAEYIPTANACTCADRDDNCPTCGWHAIHLIGCTDPYHDPCPTR